ncbi:hypothetical protein MXB_2511, partial [Myxobolus squamalis]
MLMAIDSSSGVVLWSINEDDTSFLDLKISKNLINDRTLFIPSTTGNLYRITENIAELVTYDDNGRTNFNKNYYISCVQRDIVTIGVNIVSGKLYYYCSSFLCFKN